ncbi:hypothetical protein [uncultured Roseobacter sp.]|uniref:hypothetical protein n=1 Tax=uncultured Roseobacter sp. TaxID=114847 RepID=UPI0026331221|nr:hypothetical protein [uncultured Roseobacter sp.]
MTPTRHLFVSLLVVSMASAATAQTAVEPPRFNGSRTTASSEAASVPSDAQGAAGQQGRLPTNALIGAAMLEAAREKGRYFVEERRSETAEAGDD